MDDIDIRIGRPLTLSRTQLTLALILLTLLPFGMVVLMWYSLPADKEPVLTAEVKVGPAAWPAEGTAFARTMPCVLLRNPTDEIWENVSIAINKQFFYYHPDPIPGGQDITIPLEHFRTKGNQNFPPDLQVVDRLTVFAQLPSGARAILDVDGH
jgi:hypothetical protein